MKRSMILGGVLVLALAAATGVMACDGAKSKAEAAYAKSYAETSCSKTA